MCQVTPPDGNTWFAIGGNLSRFDGRRRSKAPAEQGVSGSQISCLLTDTNGNLLVGDGSSPLVSYAPSSGSRNQPYFIPLSGSSPTNSLTRSGAGELWFTGDWGVRRLGEQTQQHWEKIGRIDEAELGRDGGTGLGLVISRQFCRMMGGDLTVTSEYGKGSTFTVTLPTEVKEPTAQPAPAAASPTRHSSLDCAGH